MRFVTKGVNQQQVIESCMDIQKSIWNDGLEHRAEWHIEVLSDNWLDLGPATSFTDQIVVRSDYKTPKHSLFKARALH